MGTPYEIPPIANVSATGGQTTVVPIQFHGRALINKLVVAQQSGNIDDFMVELFNHADALEGTETSSSDADGDRLPLAVYAVCPGKVGTGGLLAWYANDSPGGRGYLFISQDALAGRQGQKGRTLYLRIRPGGSGAKTFAIALSGETLLGG